MRKIRVFRVIVAVLVLGFLIYSFFSVSQTNETDTSTEYKLAEKSEGKLSSSNSDIQDSSEDDEADNTSVKEDTKKVVYLTFDDGPTSATAEIVDILDKYDANATFFMLEPNMKKYPRELKRLVKEGNGVGMHGVTHIREKFYSSEQSALQEMLTAQDTLYNITGVKSNLVRTPYGSIPYLTDSYRQVFKDNNLNIWDWSIDSEDWDSPENLVKSVVKQLDVVESKGIRPVILLHDRSETVKHLSELLKYLSDNNYTMKKIDNVTDPYSFKCHNRCYQAS